MINKKNMLGKQPFELGEKDAVHVAIVSVRAANSISPGESVSINDYGEAVRGGKDAVGVADPFLKEKILTGEMFWLLLDQTQISSVRHVWDHPIYPFEPPQREPEYNKYIQKYFAEKLGISYKDMMGAAGACVSGKRVPAENYSVNFTKTEDFNWDDFWFDWAHEVGHDFPNSGSDCCPEYEFPGNPFCEF